MMAYQSLLLGVLALISYAAAQKICDKYGSAKPGRFTIQNNNWGQDATQCIETINNNGFKIVQQDGSKEGGAPLSYPSLVYGCHHTVCSPGTNLPLQVNKIKSATSSIALAYADGVYDASYDIWLDPTPNTKDVNKQEIMIWLNRVGGIQPIGGASKESVTITGMQYEVWQGTNGQNNVISYVASGAVPKIDLNLMDFFNDCKKRNLFTDDWYLTSIQAGFEPWKGGVGLAVTSFDVQVVSN